MEPRPDRPFTVTTCLKQPPPHVHADAWHILLRVVAGKELLPVHARDYARSAVAKSNAPPGSASDVLAASSGAAPQDRPHASLAKKSRGGTALHTESRLTEVVPKQEPSSANSSLRILWAYPLVEGMDGTPAQLRVSSPVRLVVHAPPSTWGWPGWPGTASTGRTKATPNVRGDTHRQYWYNAAQSEEIWLAS